MSTFAQAIRQLGFHGAQFHGVRARFQNRQDACIADLAAQSGDGGRNGRRMVGEIVVDGDAANHAAHFHAPLDVAEAGQGFQSLGKRHADVAGSEQAAQALARLCSPESCQTAAADFATWAVQDQFALASSPVTR
jgi:hypothetical protein